jgi:ABC-type sugar transport system ATPase subunit
MPEADLTGLQLEAVRAAHGPTEVLHGIDLEVARGELLVVLGPSGAGKSTLLRIIAGLQATTAGRVLIAGRDVTGLRPGRRNVSMVFQSHALFPHLTVIENIAFGLEVRDVPKAEAGARAAAAAAAVGCANLLDRRPGQLSGGERQRVALARALVREPDVFLLDEPLSNLDVELRVETRAELKALQARLAATMIHVTHDQTEAMVLGDRIVVLRAGQIEQIGTPDEVWRTPATEFVGRFLGAVAMNLLPADGPVVPVGAAAAAPTPDRRIGFRPEAVRLGGADGATGMVERVDVVGEDAYAYIGLEAGGTVAARVASSGRPAVGERTTVSVAWPDVHVFDAATGQRVTGR